MAHDVFISYASEDKPIADAICASLEVRKIRCWIAPRDILPGQEYPTAIVRAINECKITVVVFSSKANSSPHIRSELQRAFTREMVIIPFRIENIEPSESMQYYLSTPHWLDAMTPPLEKHLEFLVETVSVLLAQLKKEPKGASGEPETPGEKGEGSHDGRIPDARVPPPIYAGVFHRLVAYGIDLCAVIGVWIAILVIFYIAYALVYTDISTVLNDAVTYTSGFLAYGVYFYVMEVSPLHNTVGKTLMKLQVTDLEGGRLSLSRRRVRWAVKQSPFLVPLLCGFVDLIVPGSMLLGSVGLGWFLLAGAVLAIMILLIPFDPRRQSYYDRYLGSLVVVNK